MRKDIVVGVVLFGMVALVGAFGINFKINQQQAEIQSQVQTALDQLSLDNQESIDRINQQLLEINDAVTTITDTMVSADTVMAEAMGSSSTQMSKQLESLNKELDSLRASLKVLQEKGK